MALSANTVWEVRTAGSDTNGGGFVAGASGTDYSQQNSANSGSTDKSVTDGVTNGTTTITSATANFAASIVGNIIYVSGGTGSITAGWYQVTTRNSATSITVDRSTGLTTGTGVTINIGGALLTVQQAFTNMVGGNSTYIKAGTYSISTGLTMTTSSTAQIMRVVGYSSSRSDAVRATIQATAAITMITANQNAWSFENLVLDGNSATGTNGINSSSTNRIINCVVKNLSGYGITISGGNDIVDCEVSGCGTTAGINCTAGGTSSIRGCYVHDNTVPGITAGASVFIDRCICESNTGASSDGITLTSNNSNQVTNCTLYSNGRDGVRWSQGQAAIRGSLIKNCLFVSNTGTGLNFSSTSPATQTLPDISHNAYYSNGTARAGFAAETGAVTLTGDPFVDGPNGNFALNNTAGAGAACRAAGSPGAFVGGLTTSYLDIGAAQHQDSGGGSTVIIIDDE